MHDLYSRTIIVSFKQRSIVRILLFCYKIKLIDEIIQSKNILGQYDMFRWNMTITNILIAFCNIIEKCENYNRIFQSSLTFYFQRYHFIKYLCLTRGKMKEEKKRNVRSQFQACYKYKFTNDRDEEQQRANRNTRGTCDSSNWNCRTCDLFVMRASID